MTDYLARLSSPIDWPENWAELRTIDNLLRCSICSEFFRDATVVPACSHNYCSLCIRRYLASNSNSKCPSCPMAVKDTELQNNRIIDEIVKSFLKIRSRLLKVVKNENGTNENKSKQSNIDENQKKTSNFFSSVKDSDSAQTSNISQKRPRKVTKSPAGSGQSLSTASSDATSPVLRKKLKRISQGKDSADDSSNDDISIIEQPTPQKSPVASTSNVQTEVRVEEELVDCPVCSQNIAASKINSHLDTCLTSKDRKENLRRSSSQSSSPSSQSAAKISSPIGANSLIPQVTKRKPLNKLVYTLLSEKELKKKLKEYELSTKGDRQTLVKRHQEFTLIYNSECSKARPKSVREIVRQVEEGEKKKKNLDNGREKLHFERGQSQEDIDKMKDDYVSQNQDQFAHLIKQIKSRGKKYDNAQLGEKSGTKSSPKRKIKKPTPLKKKKLLYGKQADFDEDTGSNSSADFQQSSSQRIHYTPQRKSSPVPKRVTRSSAKLESKTECSDVTSDQSVEVLVSDKDSVNSNNTSSLPDPPSPSLLKDLGEQDSDQNSSDGETIFPTAFGPSSPTSKTNEIQDTPPLDDDSNEF